MVVVAVGIGVVVEVGIGVVVAVVVAVGVGVGITVGVVVAVEVVVGITVEAVVGVEVVVVVAVGARIMPLKIERRDGSDERTVVTGMLVLKSVVAHIAAKWEPGLFPSRWGALVGGWAVEYYRKHGRAPGPAIADYYGRWAANGADADTARIVETFLGGLSDDYGRQKRALNPDHVLDVAGRLFELAALRRLQGELEADLETGDIVAARARIANSRPVEIGAAAGIDVFADDAANDAALAETRVDNVIEYPDALGNFFAGALVRDSFIGFMAKEKGGKSFWLMDMAVRGVEQMRNVAYFECGDNSRSQWLLRLNERIAKRPAKPGPYDMPLSIEPADGRKIPGIDKERRRAAERLTPDMGKHIREKWKARYGAGRLKLSCHPNSTINVNGIRAVLDGWARDGWSPDAIFVDYADILAPQDPRADRRDQINDSWKALRGLSQALHCLVVTATQTDADSYDAWVLKRHNFSEDKRKYGHINGMVGINQTTAEKAAEIYRLNWIALRDLDFSEDKCVWCAACMAARMPAVVSTF